jgi:ABC-type Fe3+-siderophore transport system permease subunit
MDSAASEPTVTEQTGTVCWLTGALKSTDWSGIRPARSPIQLPVGIDAALFGGRYFRYLLCRTEPVGDR